MRKILQTRIHPILAFVLIVIAWLIIGLVSAILWNPDAGTPTGATVSASERDMHNHVRSSRTVMA